jgi:hypothetical protein
MFYNCPKLYIVAHPSRTGKDAGVSGLPLTSSICQYKFIPPKLTESPESGQKEECVNEPGLGYNNWAGSLFLHPDGMAYSTTIFGMVMMRDTIP